MERTRQPTFSFGPSWRWRGGSRAMNRGVLRKNDGRFRRFWGDSRRIFAATKWILLSISFCAEFYWGDLDKF